MLLSLKSWLPRPRAGLLEPAPAGPDAVAEVRDAMRAQASDASGIAAVRLRIALERTVDLQGLWFLRSSLMQVLAPVRGEAAARAAVREVDALFLQRWHDAPVSRPAALE